MKGGASLRVEVWPMSRREWEALQRPSGEEYSYRNRWCWAITQNEVRSNESGWTFGRESAYSDGLLALARMRKGRNDGQDEG